MELTQTNSAYRLMQDADNDGIYKIKILECSFVACFVEISSKLMLDIGNVLQKHNSVYKFKKWVIDRKNVAKGDFSFSFTDMFQNRCPEEVLVCITSSEAQFGHLQKNALELKHCKLNFLDFTYADESFPGRPLQMQFAKPDEPSIGTLYTEAYYRLFLRKTEHARIGISLEDFSGGFSVFFFDLTPELDSTKNIVSSLPKSGVCKLEGTFSAAAEEALTIYIIGIFQSQFEITQSRAIIYKG